jgi:hypothetical protein
MRLGTGDRDVTAQSGFAANEIHDVCLACTDQAGQERSG